MLREKLFKKLLTKNRINILENAINILLLTHNDLDGSGPVIILNKYFELIETIHCSNENMDQIISDNVLNEDILNSYDAVFITDIHCSKDTADKINELNKNNQDKIFLLDHHKTAMWLNEYPFAVIETNNPEDSFSHIGIRIINLYNYKDTGTLGNASATTLLYDFMLSVFRSRGNDCIDVSEIAKLYGGGGHPQAAGCAINKEAQLSYVKAILNFN